MQWQNGRRRKELPDNWRKIREQTRKRYQNKCATCGNTGNEADHIGNKHDHSQKNLRWLCKQCHMEHTMEQSAQGLRKYHANRKELLTRPKKKHPGLL